MFDSAVNTPVDDIEAIMVEPCLKISLPPDSSIVKLVVKTDAVEVAVPVTLPVRLPVTLPVTLPVNAPLNVVVARVFVLGLYVMFAAESVNRF